MNYDLITLHECFNNGAKIYLYFIDDTGQWCAFGVSAYLLNGILKRFTQDFAQSFSQKMQMPTLTINDAVLEKLCADYPQCSIENGKMLNLAANGNLDGYAAWTSELRYK